jgi:hypothetical protein
MLHPCGVSLQERNLIEGRVKVRAFQLVGLSFAGAGFGLLGPAE